MLASFGTTALAAQLSVGMAERDITPDWQNSKVWMAGYGRNRPAEGLRDPISARATVLSDGKQKVALLSLDVIGLFFDEAMEIRSQLKDFDYVLVHATHNHAGPDTMGLSGPDEAHSGQDLEYMARLRAEAAQAVRDAEKALQPCEQAWLGQADVSNLTDDDRIPIVIEGKMRVLAFKSARGEMIGMLVFWTNHPESLGPRNHRISADYVGDLLGKLKETHKCPASFFNGTLGGMMSPGGEIKEPPDDTKEQLKKSEWCKAVGLEAARRAEEALGRSKPVSLTPFTIKQKRIALEVGNKRFAAAAAAGLIKRRMWIAEQTDVKAEIKAGTPCMETEVSRLIFGDLELINVPGEMYPELAIGGMQNPVLPEADFPNAIPEKPIFANPSPRTRIVVGLANDEVGYIIPKCQWDAQPPFCYGIMKGQYGEENSIGPNCAKQILQAIHSLADPVRSPMLVRLSREFLEGLSRQRAEYERTRKQISTPFPTTRAIVHIHSSVSHDSRGTYEEITEAANKLGIKALCFTEHTRPNGEHWNMQKRGMFNGVLLMPGVEGGGGGCLQLAHPLESNEIIKGLFAKHTEGHTFKSIMATKADGMEIYNTHSDMLDHDLVALMAAQSDPATLMPLLSGVKDFPQETFAVVDDYPAGQIMLWDALNRARSAVFPGVGASDSHCNVGLKLEDDGKGGIVIHDTLGHLVKEIPSSPTTKLIKETFGLDKGPFVAQIDPYIVSFNNVMNHVCLGEITQDALIQALKAGRCYVGMDWICPTDGAGFWCETGDDGKFTFGQTVEFRPGMVLKARLPLPCFIRIIRDGSIQWMENADAVDLPVTLPGKYRLEAFLQACGDWYPWIITNPISVTSASRK